MKKRIVFDVFYDDHKNEGGLIREIKKVQIEEMALIEQALAKGHYVSRIHDEITILTLPGMGGK